MSNEVSMMASVQDKVRERIQQSFMDLLPAELFESMVKAELEKFTKTALPALVADMAKERLKELLKVEFNKSEWQDRWIGGNGANPSALVEEILKKAAPDFVAAMFQGFALQIVQRIRSGSY